MTFILTQFDRERDMYSSGPPGLYCLSETEKRARISIPLHSKNGRGGGKVIGARGSPSKSALDPGSSVKATLLPLMKDRDFICARVLHLK